MTIRGAVALLPLVLGGCGEALQSADPGDGDRPNVLIYVVDTLRVDSLRLHGNDRVETPSLDRLAAEGASFLHAYASAPWTRPSIASILTGRYPDGHGAQGRHGALRSGIEGLAQRLGAAGYATACITTNTNVAAAFGFDRGFDRFVEFYDYNKFVGDSSPDRMPSRGANEKAIEWLEGVEEPFFLFVLSVDPHAPHHPPPAFDRYAAGYRGDLDGSWASIKRPGLPAEDVRRIRALYDAEVSSNDAAFGELIEYLRARGVYDRTLTVFTSDHGEGFWERGLRGHGWGLYQELIRVPLVLRYPPAIEAGRRVDRVVQHVDIAPTVLALTGLPIPSEMSEMSDMDGHHLLETQRDAPPPAAYSALEKNERFRHSLVVMPWKLVWDASQRTARLYHLASDPGETIDRIDTDAEAAAPLWDRLLARVAEAKRRRESQPAVAAEISEPLQRELEALGYVDEPRDGETRH
jgi:arylsulfatase A-like enzyme